MSEAGNKYGLVWEDYPEELPDNLVFVEDKSRRLDYNDSVSHMLIEGNNYHALKVLEFTHKGKIGIIYIDPPYNTGNKDFIYNDKFVEKEDSYRHSKWISFMYKRLLLARKLLSDTGVMFISIDDHEQAQLKLLCDRIFDEKNFLTTAIWQKKVRPSNKNKSGFSSTTEYVLCYCKDKEHLNTFTGNEHSDLYLKVYKNPDNDPRGRWRTKPLWSNSNTNKRKTLTLPDGRKITHKWFISQERLNLLFKNKLIHETKNTITQKIFLNKLSLKNPVNFLSAEFVSTTEQATKELIQILGAKEFGYPKPVRLLKYLISRVDNKNVIVLDFFAGSGTTGHTVLELNKEDRGNRQFILCTNNENNICTDICYPRLEKVIKGYTTLNGKIIEGIPANLVYYKIL